MGKKRTKKDLLEGTQAKRNGPFSWWDKMLQEDRECVREAVRVCAKEDRNIWALALNVVSAYNLDVSPDTVHKRLLKYAKEEKS